jgi:hypothetical protein
VGAWAPRAEQVATAEFLAATDEVDAYVAGINAGVEQRLDALHAGLSAMRERGLPVDVFRPMGAIYLSVLFALTGLITREVLIAAALLAPVMALGLWSGNRWHARFSRGDVVRAIGAVLALSGLSLLLRSL